MKSVRKSVLAGLGVVALMGVAQAEWSGAPTVRTASGVVVGKVADGSAEFLGIPYAAPPVGDLRLRPPQPHAAWSSPLQATQYGSPCPQTARLGSPSTNEDCLFLNVFAPPYSVGRRPVMVFIHGGSFNAGNGGITAPNGPDYAGANIVERSNAVVVTINYRLSVLGFLPSPALDAENGGVSGNYGLQDQQLALRWVRQNIAAFGGDPNDVTVFGESAGGISVLYHLVSPGSAGLFQRAIAESSDDGTSVPLAVAEAIYAPVVSGLGCGSGAGAAVAACLRALPVQTILSSGFAAGPIIDGVTVPQQPTAAFAAGSFNKVPVIAGTNRNEGTYFLTVAANAAGRAPTAADYGKTIARYFGANAAAIEAAYPLASYDGAGAALAAIQTDSFFACPTENVRGLLSKSVGTYGYEFAKADPVRNFPLPAANGIAFGDAHTTELAYVFGQDGQGQGLRGADRTLSDAIIHYWTNFAASGSPNRGNLLGDLLAAFNPDDRRDALTFGPRWPAYTVQKPKVLLLASSISVQSDFAAAHHCALWASLGYPLALIEALAP